MASVGALRILSSFVFIVGASSTVSPQTPLELNNEGYRYQHGLDVQRDIQKAENLYRESARAGDGTAMYNLAVLLNATDRYGEAALWALEALKAGDQFALNELLNNWSSWPYETRLGIQKLLVGMGILDEEPTGRFDNKTLLALRRLGRR